MSEVRRIDISGTNFFTSFLTDPQSGEAFANHHTALA